MRLKSLSSLFVLCLLWKCYAEQSTNNDNVAGTCSAEPAIEGQEGVIFIYFAPWIDFNKDNVFLYLRKEGGKDILHCGEIGKPPPAECYVRSVYGNNFKITNWSGHNLSLLITDVTPELAGNYVLGGYVNNKPVNQSKCYITVSQSEGKDSREESSETVSIAVPVIVSSVIGAIVLVAAIMIYRWRKQKREYTQTSQSEPGEQEDEDKREEIV